jgi:hypothetical protein
MKRRLHIPKAAQIRGLRKAIANRKTPRTFIPSMKKRLAKLTGAVILIAALCGCAARPAAAQMPVTIQPTQQTLASTALGNNTCTGSAQTFPVLNKNQTQHVASLAASATTTSLQFVIQGIDNSGNVFNISDIGQVNGSVNGQGYFPTVQVQVTCLPNTATFTLSYSASGSGTPVNAGAFLASQIDKLIFRTFSATANVSANAITTPFGSSGGKLLFQFGSLQSGSAPALTVQCQGSVTVGTFDTFGFILQPTIAIQQFFVPATECPSLVVNFSAAGTPAGTFSLEYVFDPPGLAPSGTQLNGCVGVSSTGTLTNTVPISVGANSTQRLVPGAAGERISICTFFVSVGVAGTIQLTEGTGATCGTGSTNLSGAMTMAVGSPLNLGASAAAFATNVAGDSLCLTTASSATAAGTISFQYLPI